MPLTSPLLRNSANGQACTLRLPGVCNGETATTVLAHLRKFGAGGVNMKPSDLRGVYACSDCHDALDGRTPWPPEEEAYRWYIIARAILDTHERMHEAGVLRVGSR